MVDVGHLNVSDIGVSGQIDFLLRNDNVRVFRFGAQFDNIADFVSDAIEPLSFV